MENTGLAALHRSGAYKHLMNEEDVENLKWLQIFKYELLCYIIFLLIIVTDANFLCFGSASLLLKVLMLLCLYLVFGMLYSKYDLYSKSKVRIDVEKVKPYYLSLIEKVFYNSSILSIYN